MFRLFSSSKNIETKKNKYINEGNEKNDFVTVRK